MEPLKEDTFEQLVADCLEAYEMLSSHITVANVSRELDDDELFLLFDHLHDRFRALAPDWPGKLPLETPDMPRETIEMHYLRLIRK